MDQIAIVGGGASGLVAAVEAASRLRAHSQSASVVVYEATDKVGRSILRSGNGRCNYTNTHIGRSGIAHLESDATLPAYHNETFVNAALQALESGRAENAPTNAVQAFFDDLGLIHRQEGDGRCFPLSGKASTILNLLRDACKKLGVRIECDTAVDRIEPPGSNDPAQASFALRVRGGRILHARRVILATGGNTAASILADVPTIATALTRPVLAPLALRETKLTRRMDNIRIKCSVSLVRNGQCAAREKGEVLFRKYGISGIVVFDLSRHALPGDTLRIDVIDWMDAAELANRLAQASTSIEARTSVQPTCADVMRGIVQDPVADVVATKANVKLERPTTRKSLGALAATLKALDFTVEGVGDASLAQVHRGGVDVSCVSAASMEAVDVPGLFITGEALDVDGPCGGYNLHWAWASGLLAGKSATSMAKRG